MADALDFRIDHAALYGAMQAGDYEEVFALVGAAIAAEIEAFADDHSDVSDAYRHAALIAKGIPPA